MHDDEISSGILFRVRRKQTKTSILIAFPRNLRSHLLRFSHFMHTFLRGTEFLSVDASSKIQTAVNVVWIHTNWFSYQHFTELWHEKHKSRRLSKAATWNHSIQVHQFLLEYVLKTRRKSAREEETQESSTLCYRTLPVAFDAVLLCINFVSFLRYFRKQNARTQNN